MAIDSNLIKLAVDGYKGHVAGDYSVNDTQEALRKALVCHQVGQPGHAGGGEYPTNAECGQCFQDG